MPSLKNSCCKLRPPLPRQTHNKGWILESIMGCCLSHVTFHLVPTDSYYITQHVLIPTPHAPLHYTNRSSAMNICTSMSKKTKKNKKQKQNNIYHNFIHQNCSAYKEKLVDDTEEKGDSVPKIAASSLAGLDLIPSRKRRSCVYGFCNKGAEATLPHFRDSYTLREHSPCVGHSPVCKIRRVFNRVETRRVSVEGDSLIWHRWRFVPTALFNCFDLSPATTRGKAGANSSTEGKNISLETRFCFFVVFFFK